MIKTTHSQIRRALGKAYTSD